VTASTACSSCASKARKGVREIEATLHRGPRVVRLDGVELDFDPLAHLLLMHNEDKPGVIGHIGTSLGEAGINIINFSLGARGDGEAVAAITVDEEWRRRSWRSCARSRASSRWR
jgi:hypothetical protein